ncbi:MAG: nuclear transport factor 2 family protein [Rhizonema sp. NSF051]|nr:nuclear transport factor 2 family protein [Rhizonema sp. NSF051]
MASEISERFMQTLQQVEETGEVEPLVAMFTEYAKLSNLAMVEPLSGRDGARQTLAKVFVNFERIHSKFTNVVEGDGTAVLEWVSHGTLPTGKPINYRGVSLIETANGQVCHFRT